MPDPSDRDLAVLPRRGDAEAFGELVRRYQQSVFNVCYRLLGERGEAEDLAQEAFLRAFQRLGTYDAERPFGPWVRRVAANLCLNRVQRTAPVSVPLDEDRDEQPSTLETDPSQAREFVERAEAVRAALLDLPPRYRIVMELRHFHELSYADIAAALDLPLSDVKSTLFRARRMLAGKLEPYG